MSEEFVLLTVLGGAFAATLVVLLWKLLVTAAGIGLSQWAVVTSLPDEPLVMAAAFGVPALLAAFALTYSRRLAMAGNARTRRRRHIR